MATARHATVWTDTVAPTTAENRSTGAYRNGDTWFVVSTKAVYILINDTAGTWARIDSRVEARTSDPSSPPDGTEWLRTDL